MPEACFDAGMRELARRAEELAAKHRMLLTYGVKCRCVGYCSQFKYYKKRCPFINKKKTGCLSYQPDTVYLPQFITPNLLER